MSKTLLAAVIVTAILLIGTIVLGVVYSQKYSGPSSSTTLTPQQQCNANGYVWDPVEQVCTSTSCSVTVDKSTGDISGTIVSFTGNQCVNVASGSYLSPFAQAALKQACINNGFSNVDYTSNGPKCSQSTGCTSQPFETNSIMDGCPYLTLQPNASGQCVPPTSAQLQQLCTTSVNGCPVNSSLNSACPVSQPCYNPQSGCVNAEPSAIGCRPEGQEWKWTGVTCVNTTVSQSIAITVTSSDTATITGTVTVDSVPPGAAILWNYVLTQADSTTGTATTWQGPATVSGHLFQGNLSPTGTNKPVANQTYSFSLQLYQSIGNSPFFLADTTVAPVTIVLSPAPKPPGLQTIVPALSKDLAKSLAQDVGTTIAAANNQTGGTNPFVNPDSSVWNNSLPFANTNDPFLIVPCTSAYCQTQLASNLAIVILAWPVITQLTTAQAAEVKQSCSALASVEPSALKVSYAVYMSKNGGTMTLIGNKVDSGSWIQPLSSDPTTVWGFQVVAYVYDGSNGAGDPGVDHSSCLSQPVDLTFQMPVDLYSPSVCFNIQPLKPGGQPIPGNFMVYEPGSNMCTGPQNMADALGARDLSCLIGQGTNPIVPSLNATTLYGCNDIAYSNNCNSSGQGCAVVSPVVTVRQDNASACASEAVNTPSCPGAQSCQDAACYCPPSVDWFQCGSTSYASLGPTAAIEAGRWQSRINNVVNFIQAYNLDSVVNVQTFLNEATAPNGVADAWNKVYGPASPNCPLPQWSPDGTPPCDVTSSDACRQSTVCGQWLPQTESGTPYLYKRQLIEYPTDAQGANAGCCPSNLPQFIAGCCCPANESFNTCGDYTGCSPVANALSRTWCEQ